MFVRSFANTNPVPLENGDWNFWKEISFRPKASISQFRGEIKKAQGTFVKKLFS